jgi:hypothetical protein
VWITELLEQVFVPLLGAIKREQLGFVCVFDFLCAIAMYYSNILVRTMMNKYHQARDVAFPYSEYQLATDYRNFRNHQGMNSASSTLKRSKRILQYAGRTLQKASHTVPLPVTVMSRLNTQ